MGIFDFLKDTESESEEKSNKEFFKGALKGMNERQLLKLLILLKLDDKSNENIADNYEEIIEIAKEE